jgi:hypothetical protein
MGEVRPCHETFCSVAWARSPLVKYPSAKAEGIYATKVKKKRRTTMKQLTKLFQKEKAALTIDEAAQFLKTSP